MGCWNINGYSQDSDFKIAFEKCITHTNLDCIGLVETFLKGEEQINIPNYEFFGQNRKILKKGAKCGSGGIGVLIKKSILKSVNVKVLKSITEGIMWISLTCKKSNKAIINLCVCYLPPEYSSRATDPIKFFEELLTQVYDMQNKGEFCIFGDFNCRTGSLKDYIEAIDEVGDREVIDLDVNKYGEHFIEFLVNANCCMLNGRNTSDNNFTSVSNKGLAVVDYCIVGYECMKNFCNFKVTLANDLFEKAGCVGAVSLRRKRISDHYLLQWYFIAEDQHVINENLHDEGWKSSHVKFDRHVPASFMIDKGDKIDKLIVATGVTQESIDESYKEFCNIIKEEMYEKMEYKVCKISQSKDSKTKKK